MGDTEPEADGYCGFDSEICQMHEKESSVVVVGQKLWVAPAVRSCL